MQIESKCTGLCGSDLHDHNHSANGDIKVREPLILGHVSAGVVVATGSSVPSADFQVSDRVALEASINCENCSLCKQQRYNLCTYLRFRNCVRSLRYFYGIRFRKEVSIQRVGVVSFHHQ